MRRLILLPRPDETAEYAADFEAIAAQVRHNDPATEVILHWGDEAALQVGRPVPTLVVSLRPLARRLPVPGRVFSCRAVLKTEQEAAYRRSFIQTPPAATFFWGIAPEPRQWGPFAVIKPLDPDLSSVGLAQWCPTALLPQLRPEHFPEKHPIRRGPSLVQSFVNTGRYPSHWRVLMLCGEPIYVMHLTLRAPRPAMSSSLRQILAATIATNGGPRSRELVADREIIAFARQVFNALPDVPLQGIDILREHGTGRLFALESNPGGNTWHLSSAFGEKMRQEMGPDSRQRLLGQLDAIARAAEALTRATKAYAA